MEFTRMTSSGDTKKSNWRYEGKRTLTLSFECSGLTEAPITFALWRLCNVPLSVKPRK